MNTTKIPQTTKEANTDYPIHTHLKNRWSPRVFSKTAPSDFELRQLFEAARWAASSNNLQPWRFIISRKGTDTYQQMFDCLSEFNQSWVDAPVLMLAGYKKKSEHGKAYFHALHDLGLALGNMTMQAQSMGIALHHMAGLDWQKAHDVFGVPENYHLSTAIALGFYGGNPEDLSDDLKAQEKKERARATQDKFVFEGTWDNAF